MTKARLIVAVASTSLEEGSIWAIWRWLLPEVGIELSIAVLIGFMVAWAAFSVSMFVFTTRILKKQPVIGLPTMTRSKGRVVNSLSPEGLVKIKGELWTATSAEGNIGEGEEVEVVGEEGLKLRVRQTRPKKPIS